MQDRKVTSRELVDLYIARIESLDEGINAVVTRDFDTARQQAVEADRARDAGSDSPLLGLPVTIKDCLHVAGLPTTAGASERVGHIAEADSPVVASIRAAGAVILGKTNVPRYAGDVQTDNEIFGRTNNPWDLARTPGGSSGGAAAALAAGFCALEIGSDLSGSIRQPAAFCGVYGHKPSETAVPRTGHVPGAMRPNIATFMDVQGPLARAAADLRLAMDVIAGPDVGEDVAWSLRLPPARRGELDGFRVAFLPEQDWLPVEDEIATATTELAAYLRSKGAVVETVQPSAFGDLRDHHRTYIRLINAIISHGTPEERQARASELRRRGGLHATAQADGLMASASSYIKWCDERERFRESTEEFFEHWDVLVAPNHLTNAFLHDPREPDNRRLDIGGRSIEAVYGMVYPGLATLSGLPSTAFPCGVTAGGLPVGLQAIGGYLQDQTTIRFAQLLDQAREGFQPPPFLAGQ